MTDTTASANPPSVPGVTPRRLPGQGFVIDIKPPYDSQIKDRDRGERWLSSVSIAALVVGGPTLLGVFFGSIFNPFWSGVGLLVGIGVGGYILSRIVHRLVVYNPEWQAYVANDGFRGTMVPYGPGYHPSNLWEERNKAGNYSLKVITQTFELTVPTKTAALTATGAFQYRINLERIKYFVGVDDPSTIDNGFVAFIKSYLTAELANKTAEEGRESIVEINKTLAEGFMGHKPDGGGVTPVEFEDAYGIITVNIILDSLALPDAVQKTRDAVDEGAVLNKVVAAMLGITPRTLALRMKRGEIKREDFDKLLGNALAVSENAPLNQNVTRVDIPALTELIKSAVPLIERYLGGGTNQPPRKQGSQKRGPKPTGGTP